MIQSITLITLMLAYTAIALMIIKTADKKNNVMDDKCTHDTEILNAYNDKVICKAMDTAEIASAIELLQAHGYVVYTHDEDIKNKNVLACNGIL